ncbi:choice-of-anchor I family protein [Bradyrhizobium sp. LHD-71]|uniref:choice-of-anchor I family protein n=1 Tax=Bradyrhizobium sp. LHD-71 TaxID=3072141 RepID=UPI00280FAF91|nr:choice-of-anchor I family protein [Bradyrhizobium sp. LHD-71]MDQ8732117.1 choice-of-anchor I family protein [Bradyrhizobium sp. LHD-71]
MAPGPGSIASSIVVLDEASSLQGQAGTPTATNAIELVRLGSFAATDGNAEVVSFDPSSDQLYILNATGDKIEIVHIGATGALTKTGEIDLSALPEFGGANSVAIKNGVVAVAYGNATPGETGHVALFNAAGALQSTVEVGVLPDMLTFTPDGSRILVANEAEPASESNNPAGTVSIISLAGGAAAATVANTISFAALNGSEAALDQAGLALFPGQSAANDIEPEYIAVSPNGTRAYVTLQEVNAVAVIDLTDPSASQPLSILPLGMIDRSLVGNEFDGSDEDGADSAGSIQVENHPVFSLLQPDAIASFTAAGATYFVTANEGDARVVFDTEEVRLNDESYDLDDATFPNEADLKDDDDIGRLNVINHQGDTDGDGDIDQIVTYGGRGISIFRQNDDGTITKVRETGGEFEKILGNLPDASTNFNGENTEDSFDSRSDNKGPEPEGIAVQAINGRLYAFVTLERAGGVMVYDVTDPANASFVSYEPPAPFSADTPVPADNAPETVISISAADSPMSVPLVVTANEVGNSTTVYAAVTSIPTIQGSGHTSALEGQTVTTLGVVTAIDTNGSRGFYIQDPNGDGNASTSDAIFVFTNAGPPPGLVVGQLVSVTGIVDEFTVNGAAPGSFSTTEIDARASAGGTINVLGAGPAVAATLIGGDDGLLPPSDSFEDASAFYESLEGMRVTVREAVVVGPSNDFGEIYTVIDNDTDRANGVNGSELNGRGALQIEGGAPDFGNIDVAGGDFNPERLQIDDDNGVLAGFITPDASVGAQLADVTGIVNYDFGNYQVVATEAFAVEQPGMLTKETTALEGTADRLTVASYNAENLDPNDGAARFDVIAEEIINNLRAPDVVTLQEVQDNDGPGNEAGSTVTAADVTLQMLVDALNEAAPEGVEYAFLDNPFIGDDTNGGEGGGNIRTAFVYRTDRVDFVEGSLRTIAANGDAITDPAGNSDQQTNPDNPFFDSRVPLAATFEFNGEEVTVINNHFTSKGGSGALYGSDPSPFAAGEVQRAAQAQAVNSFVDGLLAADADARVVVAGDLNDFEFEQPLSVIRGEASVTNYDVPGEDPFDATATYTPGGTSVLHDLSATLPEDEQYDYVFEGNAQTLDHLLVSDSLQDGAEFDVVRINAEFADQTSDHDPLITSLEIPAVDETFTLQLLHLSDAEAGLLASDTAPNLAALVDAYDDDFANTLILSGGDNFLPGPFLAAGTDLSVIPTLNEVTGSTIAANANVPIGAVDIAILNSLGVEASTIGNHEFDLGSRVLRDAFMPDSVPGWVGADFVYLSSNLDFSGDADLNPRFTDTLDGGTGTLVPEANTLVGRIAPSAVITEGGEKIGLVGATTQLLESISSPSGTEVEGFPTGSGANGEVDDMALLAQQLQPAIDELIAEGVNKIIVQSHLQNIANEQQLATLLRGVDIILSAGSNTRLADANDELVDFPGHEAVAEGPYPIVTQGADGNNTLIVNTDGEFTYLGRLVVDFDANGNIIMDSLTANQSINGAHAATAENVAEAWETTVDNLDDTAFADGTKGDKVEKLTQAVEDVINIKDGNVFGFTNVYLEGERAIIRNQETNLGNITADANAFAADQALDDAPFLVSLKNGGGIRAQIGTLSEPDPVTGEIDKLPPAENPDANKPAGAISQLDIENALRFNNRLMVFDTTPQELLNILNWGAGLSANNGGFPQIGGIRFSFDPDLPGNNGTTPGSRIRDVALVDENDQVIALIVDDGVVVSGAPSLISVVTLNFTANGGDGYPVKANGENFRYLLDDGTLSAPVSEDLDFTAPENVPTNALGEQQAFAEYLQEFHSTPETAYEQADTPTSGDTRVQNLNFREDTVDDSAPLAGTDEDDDLEGTLAGDTIDAKDGDDRVRSLAGNDVVLGGAGDDVLEGGDGDDRLEGGDGDDFVFGDAGADTIIGGKGDDRLRGNDGNDVFLVTDHASDGADKFDGGAGIDAIDFSASSRPITLTLADGTATFGSDSIVNVENILGGSAADRLIGNIVANELHGGAGGDRLEGRGGNDRLFGEAGNDTLIGGDGDDLLDGGDGSDTLDGGIDDDELSGAAGDDQLRGGDGDDRLAGGEGDDKLDGGIGDDQLLGSVGNDTLFGKDGDDLLDGGDDNDMLDGGKGDDQILGGAGDDTLRGDAGNDVLFGGAGNDVLLGHGDDDLLVGGAGDDTLTGGAGIDQFGFNSAGDGIDTITDFRVAGSAQDQIVLSATMFENFAGDDAFDLIGSGFLRTQVVADQTQIQIDIDGGGDGFQALAMVNGNISNGVLADHLIVVQDPIA